MNKKERFQMYVKICERAEQEGIRQGDRMGALMDIESADGVFNLRLDDSQERRMNSRNGGSSRRLHGMTAMH